MRRAAALLLVVSFVLYAPTLDHFFVSDDFLNLERNAFRTVADGFGLFATTDVDFYRPLPRLHFGMLWGLAGNNVVIWNVVGVALHALCALAAAALASSLLGDRDPRASLLTGLAFAVHFIHVEPVVWASGVTTLWVTLFLLLSLLLFRRARAGGSVRTRTLSVLCFAGALLAKETAVAFVVLLPLTNWLWPVTDRHGRRTCALPTVREALPYAVLLVAWAAVVLPIDRGGELSPYRFALGSHVVKNGAFFLLASFVPVRYWAVQELWTGAAEGGGLPAFLGALAREPALGLPLAAGGVLLVVLAVRGSRTVRGGLLWILVAAAPFLALRGSGERFVYLASFGACLVLGIGGRALLARHVRTGPKWAARGLILLVLAGLALGSLDRQSDWSTAGAWTRGIVARWDFFEILDPEEPIEFIGVPERHRSAWVFRNGFPSMVRLYWEGRPYRLEGEAPAGSRAPRRLGVFLHPNGKVGMMPARLLPES